MSRECCDCYYSEPDLNGGNGRWRCKKKHISFWIDQPACSSFVPEEAKSCLDCYYFECSTRYFASDDDGYCTRQNNKKVKSGQLACSYFVED